jgi:hypothetical protein
MLLSIALRLARRRPLPGQVNRTAGARLFFGKPLPFWRRIRCLPHIDDFAQGSEIRGRGVVLEEVPLERDAAETREIAGGHAGFIHAAVGIDVDEATGRVEFGEGRVFY